jgi:hypothetical protein
VVAATASRVLAAAVVVVVEVTCLMQRMSMRVLRGMMLWLRVPWMVGLA